MLQADSCLRHFCTAPNTVDQLHSSLPWPLLSEPALEHVTATGLHLTPLSGLDVLQHCGHGAKEGNYGGSGTQGRGWVIKVGGGSSKRREAVEGGAHTGLH